MDGACTQSTATDENTLVLAKLFMSYRRLAMWAFENASIAPGAFAREEIHCCFRELLRHCQRRLPGSWLTKYVDSSSIAARLQVAKMLSKISVNLTLQSDMAP